jgi:hypothetical protein
VPVHATSPLLLLTPSSALVAPWTQVEAWPRDRTCGTSCTSCVPATRSVFHMKCFFYHLLLLLSFSQPCACCCWVALLWVLATDSAVADRLIFFLPMTRRADEREDPKRGREDVPGVQRRDRGAGGRAAVRGVRRVRVPGVQAVLRVRAQRGHAVLPAVQRPVQAPER